jgi:hypothetical protein
VQYQESNLPFLFEVSKLLTTLVSSCCFDLNKMAGMITEFAIMTIVVMKKFIEPPKNR